jgi:hypothetical protein
MKRIIFSLLGVVILIAMALLVASPPPALAASNGPNNGGTFADDSSVGTVAWSNPSNAQTQNDQYATANLTQSNRTSHYLKVTDFGFSIASNATIQGIVVEVDRYGSGSKVKVFDNSIRLVKGGVISGNDKSTGLQWPNSDTDTYQSYGSSSDLWGLNWTPADINSSNFGVVISAIKDDSKDGRTAKVDHIRITVYYASPQQPPSNPPHLEVDKSASPGPGCGEATVTLTVTGAGEPTGERLPVDVMLIIDRSGSMAGDKMTATKAAAIAFVDLLDSSQDRVGLVSYSDSATLNQVLTTDFAAVKTAINGLVANGYTDIGDAIDTANQELTTNGRSPGVVWVEILLTDGLPNRPNGTGANFNEADAAYARGFAQAAHTAGITLYTIGLGSSMNPSTGISYYFLDDLPASGHTYRPGDPAEPSPGAGYNHDGLAYIGGGHFYPAPTPSDLQFMFEEISQEISSIAGTNVMVTEVLPDGVNYADSAVPTEPNVISPDGQTLTWNLGSISIGDTKTITFDVTFDNPGYQLVDEHPETHVDYTNYEGDPASEIFPVTHVTVPGCDDGNPCTIDTCENGQCVHTPIDCDYLDGWVADGSPYTACNGTDVCTYQDMVYLDYECVGGNCVPTETDWRTDLIGCVSCDDGNPCTIDTCVDGECVHTPINCDYLDGWVADGDPYTVCNGTDVCTYQDMVYLDYECVGGECVPTETDWRTDLIGCVSCDDGNPCTIDTCVDGECVHTPINCDYLDGWVEDGSTYTACNGTDVCTYQDMVYLDYECVGGNCVPTETDWRTDLIGCVSCDDGNPCTIDTCVDGACVHTPINCDYLDGWVEDGSTYTTCNGTDVCTYQDMVYLDYECVGGNCVPTETDWRTDLIGCQSCDDGDPCTIDTCVDGECVHTPINCDYLDGWVEDGSSYTTCNGTDVCTYQDMVYLDYECVGGNCVPTETDWRTDLIGCVSCDDGNPCTIDTCVDGECVHIPAAPTATASSNSPVSQGATIQLTGGPDDMESYSWTGPGGWTNSDRNPTRTGATTAMAGTYTLTVTNRNGCTDDDTTNVVVMVPVVPTAGGGGGCPVLKVLTVDWEGNNTTKPLYSNNRLAVDLLGPSLDGSHSLLLERGTNAPIVGGKTYYLIVIRELEEIPALPENTVAIVVFNITPAGAEFDRDIFLTLGLDQSQLPENALNVTMAYYDDVNGVWVPLESEAGGPPNSVSELSLSAPINHFSIFGVLVEIAPTPPPPPAHFVPSGLSIMTSVEKIWEPVTFVTKTGESVTITANVANDGGQAGTYTVVLKLNGEAVDTQTVTLGAGRSQEVSFTRSGLDYGQYDVEVAGLSGEFTASRTITWWLIIVIIAAIGLIIWGVVWIRRRRKAHQAAE